MVVLIGFRGRWGYRGIGLVISLALCSGAAPVLAQPSRSPSTERSGSPSEPAPVVPIRGATSSPEAIALFADAANFQNNKLYDLAAEEWTKFLSRFPYDPLAGRVQLQLGLCRMQQDQPAAAASAFERGLSSGLSGSERESALVSAGWCRYSLGQAAEGQSRKTELTQAESHLATAAQEFPRGTGKLADQALFFLGETRYELGQPEQALSAYQRLLDKAGTSPLVERTLYAAAMTAEELGRDVVAGPLYRRLIDSYPEHANRTEAVYRLGSLLLREDFAAPESDPARLDQAQAYLEQAASERGFARTGEALASLGRLYARKGDEVAAAATFAKLARSATSGRPTTAQVSAAFVAGQMYYRAKDYAAAEPFFVQVVGAPAETVSAAERIEAAHWLARIRLSDGRAAEALNVIDAARSTAGRVEAASAPYGAALELDRADALARTPGQEAAALAAYVELASARDRDELAGEALSEAASLALTLERFDEAATLAEKRIAWRRPTPTRSRDRGAESDPSAPRLPDPQPGDAEAVRVAREVLAEARLRAGNYPEAVRAYRTLLDALPPAEKTPARSMRFALALLLAGEGKEAAEVATRVATETSDPILKAQAMATVGDARTALGQPSLAVSAYRAAVRTAPESPSARRANERLPWVLLPSATALREGGRTDQALAALDEALATNPPPTLRPSLLHERGLALIDQKQYDAAAKVLGEVATDAPRYAALEAVLYDRAWAISQIEGRESEAEAAFADLVAAFPQGRYAAEVHLRVGTAAQQAGRLAEAEAALIKAADAARRAPPGDTNLNADILYRLAWVQYQQDRYQEADASFTALLDAKPSEAQRLDALLMRAECLFAQDRYRDAFAAYQQARPALENAQAAVPDGNRRLLYLHGGAAAREAGQAETALDWLAKLTTGDDEAGLTAEAELERGLALQSLDRVEDALTAFRAAADSDRGVTGARARFMAGEVLFAQKQFDEAVREFLRGTHGYGGDNAPDAVRSWQARSAYEAARCHDIRIAEASGETRQTHLASAVDLYRRAAARAPGTVLARQATQRSETLASLRTDR